MSLSPSSSVHHRSPGDIEIVQKMQRFIFSQAPMWTCACALSVLLIHNMLTSSMGAVLSLLRSMLSLVVIETARSGNPTSQEYHLLSEGRVIGWIQ